MSAKNKTRYGYELEVPPTIDLSRERVGSFFELDFPRTVTAAEDWKDQQGIEPAETDDVRIVGTWIDEQVDFDFEADPSKPAYEGARLSIGPSAVTDLINLLLFIYTNLGVIHKMVVTLDTHFLSQIFHPIFWVSALDKKTHPAPFTAIFPHEVGTDPAKGHKWMPNPMMCYVVTGQPYNAQSYANLLKYAQFYTNELQKRGKQVLVIWPYHCRLGTKGASLAPALMEALDFFEVARWSPIIFRLKGDNRLTEAYSPFGDEVTQYGKTKIGEESDAVIQDLLNSDILIITGQALSHCVRAAIYDVLRKILAQDPALAKKVYILVNASSPVPSFEQAAEDAVNDFRAHGMNIVTTDQPIIEWPNLPPKVKAYLQRKAA